MSAAFVLLRQRNKIFIGSARIPRKAKSNDLPNVWKTQPPECSLITDLTNVRCIDITGYIRKSDSVSCDTGDVNDIMLYVCM